tara:strand:- start:1119 stop:1985 length:867 start_codon:yes stop_codon:yes gene_type:complete
MSENIPWEDTYDMAKLMYLIYGYIKKWKINNKSDFTALFKTKEKYKVMSNNDTKLLSELTEKYPRGKILKYYTNKLDLQCVIGENPKKKRYDIVFRGTDSFYDCLIDLFICQKELHDGICVHRGFYNQLHSENVFSQIKEYLRELLKENPDWSVYICGHSLAGGLSIISSYLLSREFPNTTFNIFAFASPKVGNKKFKEAYNSNPNLNLLRICYNRDIITAVPTFFYYHVGNNLWYESSKNRWHYYTKLTTFSYYVYYFFNISDHYGIKYVNALEKDYNNPDRNLICG